jgi:nicotinamide mononucleotide transporter
MLDWLADHWLEIFGFVSGVACVFFAARRKVINYPLGIVSAIVFMVVFFEVRLYADLGLQVVYVVLGITGWISWRRAPAADHLVATISTPRRAIPLLVLAFAGIAALLTVVLVSFTDSTTPVADAATTASSLVAQFMLNRRWMQTWFVWIATDVAFIALYLYKDLWITGLLYLVFIGLCIHGYRVWRRAPHEVAARA